MKTINIYTALMLLLLPLVAKGEITGRVVDGTAQPICFAQVIAFNNDSTIVENTSTTEDGVFLLKEDNISTINISAFGYTPRCIIIPGCENLGEIELTTSPIELQEVTVSAHRPATKLLGGALVTNVTGSYLSQLGTANDVLRWIPTVTGSDGNFSIFGKGTPAIYINGRKISNSTELEQLSSSNIKDITVISNPGAKYDASVKSVIIIKTTKAKGDGFGFNARAKSSFAYYFSPLGQFDITYRTGGLDLSLIGYASNDKTKNESNFTQNSYLSSFVKETLNQTTVNNQSEYISKFTINYQINPHHSVGGFYRLSLINGSNSYRSAGNIYKDDIILDNTNTKGYSHRDIYYSHSSNIYYTGTIKAIDLDFNLDYYTSTPQSKSQQQEFSANQDDRTITSISKSNSRLLAQKFIAAYNLSSSRIEIGEEFTSSYLNMTYDNLENILPNNWNIIKENNLAFFSQYALMIGEKIQFNAGLRYEHINYKYNGSEISSKNQHYHNFFPSLGISTQLGALGLSLSYSNKTERPTYSQLDGNIHYNNRYQYQKGNPELKPTRKETFEFMAQYQPVFLQLSFQNQRHPILFHAESFNQQEDINLITYINGNSIKELNIMAGVSVDTDNWNTQISAGIAKQWFNTSFKGNSISLNKPIGLIKWDCYIKLPLGLRFMWDYTFQTRGNMQNSFVRSHSLLNISLFKSFCNGKFDIRVAGKDLLNGNNDHIKLYSGNILIDTREKFNLRACEITFRYHLNVPKNKYKGKGAGQIEKDRMQ